MAKIRFVDKKTRRRRRRKRNQIIYESDENLLKRARDRLEVDDLVIQPTYRVENLEAAVRLLDQLPEGYPEADEIRRECEARLPEARKQEIQGKYKIAKLHLKEATLPGEYEKAARELEELGDYKDAKELKQKAEESITEFHRGVRIRRNVGTAAFAVLLAAVFFMARTGLFSYVGARLQSRAGKYESAYQHFLELGDFLDSEYRAQRAWYFYMKDRSKSEAIDLKAAKAGDKVAFGVHNWKVLRKEGSLALLICYSPSASSPYGHVPYHSSYEEVSWEDSSLRKYLNSTVLQEEFTELEQNAMAEMVYTPAGNEKFGIEGSRTVRDKIRILDLEEATMFPGIFTKPGVDSWLCSPGHDRKTAAVMTAGGTILRAGDLVNDDSISVCPVILVDISVLKDGEGKADAYIETERKGTDAVSDAEYETEKETEKETESETLSEAATKLDGKVETEAEKETEGQRSGEGGDVG